MKQASGDRGETVLMWSDCDVHHKLVFDRNGKLISSDIFETITVGRQAPEGRIEHTTETKVISSRDQSRSARKAQRRAQRAAQRALGRKTSR